MVGGCEAMVKAATEEVHVLRLLSDRGRVRQVGWVMKERGGGGRGGEEGRRLLRASTRTRWGARQGEYSTKR